MKPPLQLRPHDIGDARTVRCPPSIAAIVDWSSTKPKREAVYGIGGRVKKSGATKALWNQNDIMSPKSWILELYDLILFLLEFSFAFLL